MRKHTPTPCFPIASTVSDELAADPLPLFTAPVPAGFPSPADDHLEGSLDIRALLVRRPAARRTRSRACRSALRASSTGRA
jgi:hypothetical protein